MPQNEHPLTGKSANDLFELGQIICSCRDWRWCAHWVCALHREFRPHLPHRSYWGTWDQLITREIDWHQGRELFDSIRRESLAGVDYASPQSTHDVIAEVGAKCISNASWSPGLFDFNAPYRIPGLVMHLCQQLSLIDLECKMAFGFTSLAVQAQPRPRDERCTHV